jgi:glycosyltransferase involved in cell wall biosynthesis
VHFPIGGGVVGYGGKFILTIHDLKHYLSKDLVKLRQHLLWLVWCNANIRRAAKIITVSEHVKEELLREFSVPPDRVQVIANGVDERFRPGSPSCGFKMRYGLPERYVLFVGATSANKNLKCAIDAINIAHAEYGVDHQFVIAGLPGEQDAALKHYVSSNNIEKRVRFLGYINDDDLPELYANADLFLFPSVTEGFGIPPLEAMRCAIPVVAAQSTSLPEVLGDAAIWVDPLSAESIAKGIYTGLLDMSVRNMAIANGLRRAEHFSWKKMAIETIKVYREITAGC